MSRAAGLIVFLVIALSLIGGLHYYFWARLVRDTALPAPWRQIATGALWVLGLSMPVDDDLVALAPPAARRAGLAGVRLDGDAASSSPS